MQTPLISKHRHCNAEFSAALMRELANLKSSMSAQWLLETESTNDDAKTLVARSDAPVRAVFVADRQTRGRGTHGRTWVAPAQSVLLTVAVPLPCPLCKARGVTLAVGDAVQRALVRYNGAVRLKWPNDLWIAGKKAGGILCEAAVSAGGVVHLVAGIGVNIAFADVRVCAGASSSYEACALFSSLLPAERLSGLRVALAAEMTAAVEQAVDGFSPASLADVARRWHLLDALAGHRVVMTEPDGRQTRGKTVGIGACGEIILETAGGAVQFSDGTLRPEAQQEQSQQTDDRS